MYYNEPVGRGERVGRGEVRAGSFVLCEVFYSVCTNYWLHSG